MWTGSPAIAYPDQHQPSRRKHGGHPDSVSDHKQHAEDGTPKTGPSQNTYPWVAKFKIPKYVRFVQDFPMTASGKIQKYKLREEHERRLKTEN